jgi:hypothetical protein
MLTGVFMNANFEGSVFIEFDKGLPVAVSSVSIPTRSTKRKRAKARRPFTPQMGYAPYLEQAVA